MLTPTPSLETFWEYVNKDGANGCWLWTGQKSGEGYGGIREGHYLSRTWRPVHRVAYELVKGPIPKGLVIDHLCRVPSCVNPDHLEAVTDRVNVLRGHGITAQHARKTHCIHGHVLSGSNVRMEGNKRKCRKCGVVNSARYIQKKRQTS